MFWVNTTNDLINKINKGFGEKVAVSVKSMDSDLSEE